MRGFWAGEIVSDKSERGSISVERGWGPERERERSWRTRGGRGGGRGGGEVGKLH